MPTKINSNGEQQNYDPNTGEYSTGTNEKKLGYESNESPKMDYSNENANKLNGIKSQEQQINELKEKLKPKTIDVLSVIDSQGNVKYVTKGVRTPFRLTNDIDKALSVKRKDALEYKNLLLSKDYGFKDNKAQIEKDILNYSQKQETLDKINALENGFDDIYEYKKYVEQKRKDKIKNKVDLLEGSFVYSKRRNDMWSSFEGEYNPELFSEVISRFARNKLGAKIYHSSAKSGSKFSSSVYLDVDGHKLRLSNHDLPDTTQREYNQGLYGTSWNNELVLNQQTMEEIAKIKTEDEFVKYLKGLFNE